MKKALFILMCFMASYAMAQDVIVMRDGTSILSKVLEITSTEVKYKKYSNLDGPTFSVLKTEVLVINYENGEKESFEVQENVPATAGNAANLQTLSYEQLEGMKDDMQLKKGLQKADRKVKRLKIVGWITGGTLAGIGCIMAVYGATCTSPAEYEFVGSQKVLVRDEEFNGVGPLVGGIGFIAAGAAVTTICLVRANKLKNKGVMSINSAPIFQHDFRLNNGNTLAASVDLLNDSRLHERTLGLGFRYNF